MASRVKFRRGTAVQHATFIGAEGEITVNTTTDSLVVHDGIQAGGYEMLRADLNNLDSATAIPAENITDIDCGSYS
jgi:hypothetical protein